MTKKELVWRLANRPTVDEIVKLVENKVITPEEARTIAFNSVNENDKITKLEQEVELLKQALYDARRGVVLSHEWVTHLPQHQLVDPLKLFKGIIDL